ncbi:YolD-like family protein [Terribacillus sp. 179-K 1B1 HS]|uniref:YolD-like family protein n=1 Tax=Terribacillus sp. 179-K 1B1 HS TaxID=3142388 RepID=UPI00399FE990
MDIHERGTKKWTALMMPEHIGMIQAMVGRMFHEDMPIIAEDKQEDMQVDIECAVKYDKEIRVTYHDGKYIDTVVGRIASVNHQQRRLEMLVPEEYGLVYIPYNKLVDTEIL